MASIRVHGLKRILVKPAGSIHVAALYQGPMGNLGVCREDKTRKPGENCLECYNRGQNL